MKKKLIIIATMLVMILSLVVVGQSRINNNTFSSISKVNNSSLKDALSVSGDISLNVGEEYDFSDKFKLYVTEADKNNLQIQVEDTNVLYLNSSKYKFIGLKSGVSKVIISSDKYYTELNVTVAVKNYCDDGSFEGMDAGTRWLASNEEHFGWRLYTGGSAVASEQIIEVLDIGGNNVIHYKHTAQTQYSNLYKSFKVDPGQYFVRAKMKGSEVAKDVYVRVNQGNKYGLTQTQKIKETFDWEVFESGIVRVDEGESLKLEMYFALNYGEVWFDDLEIHKVITTDYTSFNVERVVEELEVGKTSQIVCSTNPISVVDYQYYYESSNSSVVTVDKLGKITALKNGIADITVRDSIYNYTKIVKAIVGTKDGINANANNNEVIEVQEDVRKEISLNVLDSTNYNVSKYSEPKYGKYYIKDNKIFYTPNANIYNVDEAIDTFEVIVFDEVKGYKVVEVKVQILPVEDTPTTVEFWHSTEKGQPLKWVQEVDKVKYSSGKLYNGGYLQVDCEDVEALYPYIYKKNMTTGEIAKKGELYSKIFATAKDGTFEITTAKGGKVTILLNGVVQEIHDRYYESQGKIIYGVLYDYIPPQNFHGYDTFELVVKNGETSVTVENTVYVTPGLEDFKFEELDLTGTYLLSNELWLEEVRNGYKNNDPYITKWVDFYEAQYSNHSAAGVPANARTPMEQLAILYKITGKQKYFDLLWEEILPVVNDGVFSPNTPIRLSWGQDSNGFLDAAMVTYSLAFAYNYIQDKLDDAQKEIIMKALYEEGFYYFDNLNNPNVLLHGNNHNLLVCGDLANAALAAMSYNKTITVNTRDHGEQTIEVQKMAANIVSTAFEYLQIGLVHYAENGGFPEGPSYSIYAHRNMVGLYSTLRNLYGDDTDAFGLSEIEGIINYVNYPLYTSSPNYQSFYYAESDYSNNQPALLWYTRIDETNTKAALLSKLAHENEQYNIQNLLFYKPGLFEKVDASQENVLDFFLDEHELATFRSEFGNEMALFTGLKGTNSDSLAFAHKNMDSGTFEIYALGERFIGNFSNETYNVVVPDGYWDYDYQRWTYYKKNAQGQNTLVINPQDTPVLMQDPNEKAEIYDFNSNETSGFAKINLSKVYKEHAVSVQRGLKVFNNRTSVLVQDEFSLRDYSTLYWSAHTEARIDIINEKLARLTINNKSMYAHIISELGSFTFGQATALPGTIGEFCNLDNEGVQKLMIKLDNVLEGTLAVEFVASLEEITEFGSKVVTPLNNWTLDDGKADSRITVDNIEVKAQFANSYRYIFNPYQKEYVVKLESHTTNVPDLNVTYDKSKYDVKVEKSNLFDNITKVVVTDKATGETTEYKYKFVVDALIADFENFVKAEIVNATGKGNVKNIYDANAKTSYTANEKSDIVFELADVTDLTTVMIRFTGGKVSTYYFDIYYSEDGQNYKCAYFAGQNFNNLAEEYYTIGHFKAKYIKLVFTGNDIDDEIKIAEVAFYNNGTKPVTEKKKGGCGGSLVGSLLAVVAITGVCVLKKKKEN